MLTFTKINHSLYNASQNFENLLVFQVTSKLLVEWGGGIILLCSLCLEYLGNEKCLRGLFLSFNYITFDLFTGKSLLEETNTFHTQIRI